MPQPKSEFHLHLGYCAQVGLPRKDSRTGKLDEKHGPAAM